ncbi:MAG: hypothetical protein HYV09_05945 [Deltaproteobacteria bacterium]|nr:hypothetical protein [Deltaproteobacteria bacterium]
MTPPSSPFFVARSGQEVLAAPLPVGWSSLPVPCGFVHPALAGDIAAALAIAAEDVLAVARYEAALVDGRVTRPAEVPADDDALFEAIEFEHAGVPALRTALGRRAALLLDAVPVIPPDDRPPARSDDPAVRVARTHPLTLAYDALSGHVQYLARLHELSAPPVLVAVQHRAVQLSVERLIATVRGEPTCATAQVAADAMSLAPPPTRWDRPRRGHVGLVFLDDRRLLVQDARSARVLRLRGGAIGPEVRVALPVRYATSDRVVFASAAAHVFVEDGLHGLALYDPARRRFDAALSAERPVRLLTGGISGPDEILAWDPHAHSGVAIGVELEDPRPGPYTRDGAFAWALGPGVDGAIVELATGDVFARTADFPFEQPSIDRLTWAGTISRGAPFAIDHERRVTAVALTNERRWRLLGPNGVVVEDDRPLFGLAFRPDGAAWSPDAKRLALARRGEIIVVEASMRPCVVARRRATGA